VTTEEDRWSRGRSAEVADLFEQLAKATPGTPDHASIRDRIVEIHMPLAQYFARRLAGKQAPVEDLAQVGAVGLLKAVDRFDPALGHEFASYAAPTMLGEIKRYLRDSGWLVRVPRRAHELHGAVAQARDDLTQELGRTPTLSEIATRVGADPNDVAETLAITVNRTGAPLDSLIEEGESGSIQGRIAVEESGFNEAEVRAVLEGAVAVLTDEERRLVQLRFIEGRSQSEIATMIGATQMQVSRLMRRTLDKMRAQLGS
jgi:RNA polymerase sigma-B factor